MDKNDFLNDEPQAEQNAAVNGGMKGKNEQPPQEPKNLALEVHKWFQELLVCLVVVTLAFAFVVRLVNVDGDSMEPTLHDCDRMVLFSGLLYEPKAGDIVVFRAQGYDEPLVKRIIATEGQTVDIDFASGVVYVDGVALDEPYTAAPTYARGELSFPQTVEEGCIFVLGDNRNDSTDSRFSRVGQVREEMILGKLEMVIWPLNHWKVAK